MAIDDASSDPELIVPCPHCRQRLTVAVCDQPREYQCWSCGEAFEMPPMVLQTPAGPTGEAEELSHPSRDCATEDELDGLRIRRLAAERRASWRTRSYALIGAVFTASLAGQSLLWSIRAPDSTRTAVWGVAFVVFGMLAVRLLRRAHRITLEVRAMARQDEPTTPPDFSTLSDGSHRLPRFDRIE